MDVPYALYYSTFQKEWRKIIQIGFCIRKIEIYELCDKRHRRRNLSMK